MVFTAASPFDRSAEQVQGMMRQGSAFESVEDAIDGAGVSQDHKAALWLVAWSLRDDDRPATDQ